MSEKKKISEQKRVKEEGPSYFCSPQKYECHSHITPFDKKGVALLLRSLFWECRSGVPLKRVPRFNTLLLIKNIKNFPSK
jgi:hypothetical protein